MTQITIEAAFSSKLLGLAQEVELCDSTGRVLGRFVPAVNLAEREAISPGVSETELDRRQGSKEKRFSTLEALAHLEKLDVSR